MKRLPLKLTAVILAAFSLSGCGTLHAIFGSNSAGTPQLRVPEQAVASSDNAADIEQGRMHLANGETGLAIESYRKALASGKPSASALNGLGVAYARLGRYDLAQRYFQEAIAFDPLDERFAANLARLYRSPAFAMRHDADLAAEALNSAAVAEKSRSAAASAETAKPGRLTRVANHQYALKTVAPMNAPLATGLSVLSRFKPLVRVELGKPVASPVDASPANEPRPRTVRNPHLGKAAEMDARFRPVVTLQFSRANGGYKVLKGS